MFTGATELMGMASTLSTIRSVGDFASGGSPTYHVAPHADYAAHVEYGTSRMAAQPYMRPARQSVEANLMTHIARASSLEAAVQNVAHAIEADAKARAPVDTGNLRASIETRRVD